MLMSTLGITTRSRITLAVFLLFLVVMHPSVACRLQERLHGGLVAGRVALQFAAIAQSLVGLDMRAGGHLLQVDLDRFRAFVTFKGKDAGWFQHVSEK
jgi:hypothetical protein